VSEQSRPQKLMDVGKTIPERNPRPLRNQVEVDCPVYGFKRLIAKQVGRMIEAHCQNGCDRVEIHRRLGLR